MKYLVTGGAGFIGSHLIELLLEKKHEIICIDDLSTGYKSNFSKFIHKIVFYEEKVELFDYTILSNIDGIFHLAAQVSVPLSISNFNESSSSNILGSINVINYCRLNNIPFIYASSSAVYGNLEFGDDEKEDIDLLSPYSTDKYSMELYSKIAFKNYQLSSVGLRFFNVYGPRQDPTSEYSGVISIFADRLLKRQDLKINGGYQTRDFIYVNDVVNIIYLAMNTASVKAICETCNVLTGVSVSIDSLAEQMMKILNIKVNVDYQSLSPGDPKQSNGSTTKMSKVFKVIPNNFIKLDKGLISTINYLKKLD